MLVSRSVPRASLIYFAVRAKSWFYFVSRSRSARLGQQRTWLGKQTTSSSRVISVMSLVGRRASCGSASGTKRVGVQWILRFLLAVEESESPLTLPTLPLATLLGLCIETLLRLSTLFVDLDPLPPPYVSPPVSITCQLVSITFLFIKYRLNGYINQVAM